MKKREWLKIAEELAEGQISYLCHTTPGNRNREEIYRLGHLLGEGFAWVCGEGPHVQFYPAIRTQCGVRVLFACLMAAMSSKERKALLRKERS